MATVFEKTAGNQDLATFQTIVQQQEGIFGPLIALSSEAPFNVMTFQIGPSPDAAHRTILETYLDHPLKKDGYRLFCIAGCLVAGSQMSVAAYRKVD